MRVLNLKNLKNCRNVGTTLFGNYGLKAIKIPSGKTVFRIQKRIKSSNYLSPFNGTIGSFPEMSIKEAELFKDTNGFTASKVLAKNDVRIYRYCTTALGKV